MSPAGIYISFPFCRQKCTFCNFASQPLPNSLVAQYVSSLQREVEQRRKLWRLAGFDAVEHTVVDTVYLGGGTPGIMEGAHLRELSRSLRANFNVQAAAEVTLEATPESVTADAVAVWRDAGVNRVSMGVQSLIQRELRSVGRRHDAARVGDAMRRLREGGIGNVSIDLIAGLPYQTEESWRETLDGVLQLRPAHISVYMLEIDDESRLGSELIRGGEPYGAAAVPCEELVVSLYLFTMQALQREGYVHYEISNFALPGSESRHNEKYWTDAPYYGFGVDAHSYDGVHRWANVDTVASYLMKMTSEQSPVMKWKKLDAQSKLEERFFLGLRRRAGVSLRQIEAQFGESAREHCRSAVQKLSERGWLSVTGDLLRLTDTGVLFSNEVFAEFLV